MANPNTPQRADTNPNERKQQPLPAGQGDQKQSQRREPRGDDPRRIPERRDEERESLDEEDR